MTDFIFALLVTLLPVNDANEPGSDDRKTELHALLDQAVTMNTARTRRDEIDPIVPPRNGSNMDEMAIDLARMELASGFLEKTCIYDTRTVRKMRLLISYASMLRSWDYTEQEINQALIRQSGEHQARLEKMLRFLSINSMRFLICEDYIHERLVDGMNAEELRGYIDDIGEQRFASSDAGPS